MNNKKIDVGIIGAGGSGIGIHGRLLSESKDRFNIISFCDTDKEKLKIAGEKFRVRTFTSPKEFFRQRQMELVIIATRPHSTHFLLALSAMQAGKNVVVEKPMCITVEEAKKMIEVSKKNKVFLFPFQNQRWNLGFMCFKEALEKKVIGEVKFIEVRRNIKCDDKGVVYEFMPHFIDCILVLLNFVNPVEVSAILENPEGNWDELGFVSVNIRFKNDVFVTISQLPDETPKTIHFYWYAAGTEGSIWQENVYNKYDLLYKNARHTGKAQSFVPEFLETKIKGEKEMKDDFSLNFYDNVYQVLREGKEQLVKPEQVLIQIEIIEKIIESARLGRAIKI